MSNAEQAYSPTTSSRTLSWPPPGLEHLQGRLWRAISVGWVGSVLLIAPLLWALATEQPFWSLGPFEGDWRVGMTIAAGGALVLLAAFGWLFNLLRQGAAAADAGYGTLTIIEVMVDATRDTGFLLQGMRHFGVLEPSRRGALVRARVRGAFLVLGGALWLSAGFGVSVLLAARQVVTPVGIWLVTLGPTALMLGVGLLILLTEHRQVRTLKAAWVEKEGAARIRAEAASWLERLDSMGDSVALGAGRKGQAGRFRSAAALVVVLLIVALIPTVTIALTASIGPILADIAVPSFLSVQEMAGAAETLRRFRLPEDESVPPIEAGSALQSIAFVGGGEPQPWERPPDVMYEQPWFPHADVFPDPFSETMAGDLMRRPFDGFSEEERAALRQAATHPGHEHFDLLARASFIDVVGGRWTLPFPDTLTFQSLPWPRFAAFRTAGLAEVAKAAVELHEGRPEEAEQTVRELVSTGFLLVDEGPTLLDNLVGVVLTNLGGDALEGLYARTGRYAEAAALREARDGARAAAAISRAFLVAEDIHSLLQGIPELVEQDGALRGLRWEYFAAFNLLAPCINVHKMVFGPDESYDEWRVRARDALVRVRGEADLFELAEGAALGRAEARAPAGFLPRFLSLALGRGRSPGSCASLIGQIEAGTTS